MKLGSWWLDRSLCRRISGVLVSLLDEEGLELGSEGVGRYGTLQLWQWQREVLASSGETSNSYLIARQ
jgi:hypothetical protein